MLATVLGLRLLSNLEKGSPRPLSDPAYDVLVFSSPRVLAFAPACHVPGAAPPTLNAWSLHPLPALTAQPGAPLGLPSLLAAANPFHLDFTSPEWMAAGGPPAARATTAHTAAWLLAQLFASAAPRRADWRPLLDEHAAAKAAVQRLSTRLADPDAPAAKALLALEALRAAAPPLLAPAFRAGFRAGLDLVRSSVAAAAGPGLLLPLRDGAGGGEVTPPEEGVLELSMPLVAVAPATLNDNFDDVELAFRQLRVVLLPCAAAPAWRRDAAQAAAFYNALLEWCEATAQGRRYDGAAAKRALSPELLTDLRRIQAVADLYVGGGGSRQVRMRAFGAEASSGVPGGAPRDRGRGLGGCGCPPAIGGAQQFPTCSASALRLFGRPDVAGAHELPVISHVSQRIGSRVTHRPGMVPNLPPC